MSLSHDVSKILTAFRMLQISIAQCQMKAKIHSFPTMYISGWGRCGRNGSNQGFRPRIRPKNNEILTLAGPPGLMRPSACHGPTLYHLVRPIWSPKNRLCPIYGISGLFWALLGPPRPRKVVPAVEKVGKLFCHHNLDHRNQ